MELVEKRSESQACLRASTVLFNYLKAVIMFVTAFERPLTFCPFMQHGPLGKVWYLKYALLWLMTLLLLVSDLNWRMLHNGDFTHQAHATGLGLINSLLQKLPRSCVKVKVDPRHLALVTPDKFNIRNVMVCFLLLLSHRCSSNWHATLIELILNNLLLQRQFS